MDATSGCQAWAMMLDMLQRRREEDLAKYDVYYVEALSRRSKPPPPPSGWLHDDATTPRLLKMGFNCFWSSVLFFFFPKTKSGFKSNVVPSTGTAGVMSAGTSCVCSLLRFWRVLPGLLKNSDQWGGQLARTWRFVDQCRWRDDSPPPIKWANRKLPHKHGDVTEAVIPKTLIEEM